MKHIYDWIGEGKKDIHTNEGEIKDINNSGYNLDV